MIGYDKFDLNFNLILDLPMREMAGVLAMDRSKGRVPFTLHGPPTWNSWIGNDTPYLDFAPGDWLDCPAAYTEFDFTSEMFSIGVWLNVDDLSAHRYVMVRGVANTDGWLFFIQDTGRVFFSTCQAGATQSTFGFVDIVVGNWYLAGITRSGADVTIYINGVSRTDGPDVHVNPLTAARELHIGIQDDEVTLPFDGQMYRPRIWDMRVLTLEEWQRLFELEKGLVGL